MKCEEAAMSNNEMIEKWSQILDAGEVPSEWHGDYAPVYATRVPVQPLKTLSVKVPEGLKLFIIQEAEERKMTPSALVNEILTKELIKTMN